MMRAVAGLCIILILFSAVQISANDTWRISGYYKNYFVANAAPFGGNSLEYGRATNRLRLTVNYSPSETIELNTAYDLIPTLTSTRLQAINQFFGMNLGNDYRVDDLDASLYPENPSYEDEFRINQNLDRFFLTIHASFGDMYFGRQAIAWGSARVINPTDVLVPFSYDELDVEDRRGVDAVRLRIPIGFMGEFDAGYLFGNDFDYDYSAMYLRGKYYLWQTDISGMLINFQENMMLGIDLARAIGGAGTWLETAWVNPDAFNPDGNESNENNYIRVTVGADYSFGDKTYGFLEYHYNGAGTNEPDEYYVRFQTIPYREGGVFLFGKHYLIPGVNYQITPLIIFNGSSILNLTDQSALIIPEIEYNIAENIYLSGGAYIGLGEEGNFNSPPDLSFDFGSEFGDYPNTFFTSFRVYF